MKKIHLIGFFFMQICNQAWALENQLHNHASPYLAMHGSDPVAWQQWNRETVKRAKAENKLIFLSSGYYSCHWCHVMQRESFKNRTIAALLNNNFIPVKVDREIHSALDNRLIDFVQRTQGYAGWPLSVFITPDGYPLVGMTYVPTKKFKEILSKISMKWRDEKSVLNTLAINTTKSLSAMETGDNAVLVKGAGEKLMKLFMSNTRELTDDMSGGFGEQNKFPQYPQLQLMLKYYEQKPAKELKEFLLLTLDKMATQGLYDHLGGGFFRYTVDPAWQIPHFEKMLYDNALLAIIYMDAARIFKNEMYARVAKETLEFLSGVFRVKQGAFIASLSAIDAKGNEGGYYLWKRDELKRVLTRDEMAVIELVWQLEGVPELDGGHHLKNIMSTKEAAITLNITPAQAQKYFISAHKKLNTIRNKRQLPRDDKLLASWNALALSAFSRAAKQFNNPHYAKIAGGIKKYINNHLWRMNKLVRAVKDDKVIADAGLEDYAYLAQGLYDWNAISGNEDRQWQEDIIRQAWRRFYINGHWVFEENSLLKYREGEVVLEDSSLPSPAAVLISVTLKSSTGHLNPGLRKKAIQALGRGHDEIKQQPFNYASQLWVLHDYLQ